MHGPQVPGVCHAEELHFLFRWNIVEHLWNFCGTFVELLWNIEILNNFLFIHSTATFQSNAVGDAQYFAKRQGPRGGKMV